jgi:hypothetical protein
MPKQTTHVRVVREWLTSLGILAAVSLPREEAQLRLAAFLPLLMDRFPDAAFTTASLQHVAGRAMKGFPTYGELAAWLSEWWRENRPAPPSLPPPDIPPPRSPPTPEEIEAVHRTVEDVVAHLRASRVAIEAADQRIEVASDFVRARYLTPEQLDRINPLPGGPRGAPANQNAAPPVGPDAA